MDLRPSAYVPLIPITHEIGAAQKSVTRYNCRLDTSHSYSICFASNYVTASLTGRLLLATNDTSSDVQLSGQQMIGHFMTVPQP